MPKPNHKLGWVFSYQSGNTALPQAICRLENRAGGWRGLAAHGGPGFWQNASPLRGFEFIFSCFVGRSRDRGDTRDYRPFHLKQDGLRPDALNVRDAYCIF
jgi:hypothetical protein